MKQMLVCCISCLAVTVLGIDKSSCCYGSDYEETWYGGLERGFSTVGLAPVNVVVYTGRNIINPLLCIGKPHEAVCDIVQGCYYCVQDVTLGIFDMLSLGRLGNRYFYNKNSWDCKAGLIKRLEAAY